MTCTVNYRNTIRLSYSVFLLSIVERLFAGAFLLAVNATSFRLLRASPSHVIVPPDGYFLRYLQCRLIDYYAFRGDTLKRFVRFFYPLVIVPLLLYAEIPIISYSLSHLTARLLDSEWILVVSDSFL